MLAVERAWFKKTDEINEMFRKLHPSRNGFNAPFLVRWSVFQQKPLIERVVKLIGCPDSAKSDKIKVVEGSIHDELAFFKKVVVPRLQEAGFSRISVYMEEVEKAARLNQSSRDALIRTMEYGSSEPQNLEWLYEFKDAWRRFVG